MIEREISAADRNEFLARFSRLHDGTLVTVRVDAREEARDRPFHGVRTEEESLTFLSVQSPPILDKARGTLDLEPRKSGQ